MKDCPKCHGELVEIGQEIWDNLQSIYVYECQECHRIVRTLHQIIKEKVGFVFR